MLDEICAHINNHFTHRDGSPYMMKEGEFTIIGGVLHVDGLKPGGYYLIQGSDFNDGVHQYMGADLVDETFTGRVFKMSPPPQFLALAQEIEAWCDKYGETVNSPFQSENVIGVYSYQLKAAGMTVGTSLATWQTTFKDRLKPWRKLYDPAR